MVCLRLTLINWRGFGGRRGQTLYSLQSSQSWWRVWEKEVLEKIGQLCQKHGVFLVSDEIHQDLALFGHKHHPFNTINPAFKDFAIVLSSATKPLTLLGQKFLCSY